MLDTMYWMLIALWVLALVTSVMAVALGRAFRRIKRIEACFAPGVLGLGEKEMDGGRTGTDRIGPCDHKHGDGPDEYSKMRTCVTFEDETETFRIDRCDACKKFALFKYVGADR